MELYKRNFKLFFILFLNFTLNDWNDIDSIFNRFCHAIYCMGTYVDTNIRFSSFFQEEILSQMKLAIKYFMFGALSSSILVLAIGFVYAVTGTTNIGDSITILAELSAPNQTPDSNNLGGVIPISYLAIGLFVAGFGFKMGLVPFHMWLPDTYEGAPTTIGALLAAGTKKAGFAAAIRVIVIGMFAIGLDWSIVLAILAVITMTVGNFGALIQKSCT